MFYSSVLACLVFVVLFARVLVWVFALVFLWCLLFVVCYLPSVICLLLSQFELFAAFTVHSLVCLALSCLLFEVFAV